MAQQRKLDQEETTNVDPEMLKNLDLLMNMDVIENEADWDSIENLEQDDEFSGEEFSDEA